MRKYVILCLLALTVLNVSAQSFEYDIILFGKSIGKGEASVKQIGAGQVQYNLYTQAEANVMFKNRTSLTDINLSYDANTLTSCSLMREKDGNIQEVEIVYEGGRHYYIENEKRLPVQKRITYTTTRLFFEEPVGVSEVYVERLNVFVPIEYEGDGVYKTVIEGGDNYYHYENGILVEFRLKKGVNIYMKKV